MGNTTGFDPVISSSSLDIPVCGMEKFGLSRQVHALKIVGSNPSSAILFVLFFIIFLILVGTIMSLPLLYSSSVWQNA